MIHAMRDLFNATFNFAQLRLVVVGSFLYTAVSVISSIFDATTDLPMPHFTFTEVIFNIFAFAVIYMLHRGLRDVQRTLDLKRLADTYVSNYRATVLYQGGTLFANPSLRSEDLAGKLQSEADAVINAIMSDHPDLSRKQVTDALAGHYGW